MTPLPPGGAQVLGTGKSGAAEPTGPSVPGQVIGDNSSPGNGVVWMCVGLSGALPATQNAAPYYNGGQPQSSSSASMT